MATLCATLKMSYLGLQYAIFIKNAISLKIGCSGEKQLRATDLSDWRVETSGIHDYNVFVTGYTLRHAKICITFLKPPQFVFHQPILVIVA